MPVPLEVELRFDDALRHLNSNRIVTASNIVVFQAFPQPLCFLPYSGMHPRVKAYNMKNFSPDDGLFQFVAPSGERFVNDEAQKVNAVRRFCEGFARQNLI